MYCWVDAVRWATPDEDAKLMLLYGGTDEDEARRIAREAAAEGIYAKVVAKAMGGQHLFHFVSPSFSANRPGKSAKPADPAKMRR
jgi:hypothetical protein